MNVNSKAPPVYKPSPPRLSAPPVYRPNQINALSAQLKPANNFRLETRPAPPVYRPDMSRTCATAQPYPGKPAVRNLTTEFSNLQMTKNPLVAVVQRMEDDGSRSKGTEKSVSRNFKNLKCYRPGFMTDVEKEFQRQGYHLGNIKQAIVRGLKAWGGVIPGHCSSKPGKDSGEQPETGPQCEAARDFLLAWVTKNPAPKSEGSSGSGITTKSTKEERKKKRVKEKREKYEEENGPREYIPPWQGGESSFYKPSWKTHF